MSKKEYRVFFQEQNIEVTSQAGERVIDLVRSLGLDFPFPCNGQGRCGKCQIEIKSYAGVPTALEIKALTSEQLAQGIRLACQTTIASPLTIHLKERERFITPIPLVLDKQGMEMHQGTQNPDNYGVAIDLGTTTLVAYLINLQTGNVEKSIAGYNPQSTYGTDVIARIEYASSGDGLPQLQNLVVKALNELIERLITQAGLDRERITEVNVVGNTAMTHILLGISPVSLGQAPYQPVFLNLRSLSSDELALPINPVGRINILPGIGGHVGSDVLVGVVACEMEPERSELLIDFGTNGEIVVSGKGRIIACSAAAGPAFEGAEITCGMQATAGAITDLWFEEQIPFVKTVEDDQPQGICGSGLVRIMVELIKNNFIDETGHFTEKANHSEQRFYLSRSPQKEIYLTQKDIRSFQVAKAAIRTGVELLIQQIGLSVEDIQTVYIGGAFGSFVRAEDLLYLGILPPGIPMERIQFVGNSAGLGAVKSILSQLFFEEVLRYSQMIEHYNLADDPSFTERFTEALLFDHR